MGTGGKTKEAILEYIHETEVVQLFMCTCIKHVLDVYFKFEEVFHITCKFSLLICFKLLLDY